MSKPTTQAGIKDIADALGVSIGTVDRALHARAGVKAATRERVLKMARELGYRPNVAARALKLNRRLRIAVLLPKHISSFFDPLREGIRHGAHASFGAGLELHFSEYPRLGSGDLEMLKAAIAEKYDGVLCTPGDVVQAAPLIRELNQGGTAVVCVASDAPRTERIGAVSADSYIGGALAAELLGHVLPARCRVANITGALQTLDHAEKLRGFAATLALIAPQLSLLPVVESHDSAREAYKQAKDLLGKHPELQGLYISTANSLPVLEAVEERKKQTGLRIITTDLYSELIPRLEAGKIVATLYQRPFTQGKLAIQMLLRYLLEGTLPGAATRLPPHIVLRSNLPVFAGYVADPKTIPG